MNYSHYSKFEDLDQGRRFSPLDLLTLLLSAGLIAIGSHLLINYKDKVSGFRDLVPIAKVGEFEYTPKRKVVGTLSWAGVQSSEFLFKGDQILTDEKSTIEVKFLNKTFLNVPPKSLIKIGYAGKTFDIELVKGFVDINLSKGNEKVIIRKGDRKYQINSKKGKVQVFEGIDGLNFKAVEGEIQLKEDDAQNPIEQKLKYSEQSFSISNKLSRQKFNPTVDRSIPVSFKFNDLKLIKNPKIIISKDPKFKKYQTISLKIEQIKKGLNLPIPNPGAYYLAIEREDGLIDSITPIRVLPFSAPIFNAMNVKKIEEVYQGEKLNVGWRGRRDLKYQIQIKRDGKIESSIIGKPYLALEAIKSESIHYRVRVNENDANWTPWQTKTIKVKPGLIVDTKLTPSNITKESKVVRVPLVIKNQSNIKAQKYLFQVSKDKQFRSVIHEEETNAIKNKIAINKPGIYFWRATQSSGSKMSTGPQKLTIRSSAVKLDQSYSVKQISIKPQSPVADLKWVEEIPGTNYRLTVKDKDGYVNTIELKGNKAQVKLPKLGTYQWQIEPVSNKDILYNSREVTLNITLPPEPIKPLIRKKQVIYYRFIKGIEAYEIKMPEYKYAQIYQLEVFRDSKAKTLVFKKSFADNKGYWISSRSGKYYYRVRVTDKWGRTTPYSDIGVLIFPISPLVK